MHLSLGDVVGRSLLGVVVKEKIPYKGGLSILNEIVCTGRFSEFIKIALIFFFFVRRRGRVREIC